MVARTLQTEPDAGDHRRGRERDGERPTQPVTPACRVRHRGRRPRGRRNGNPGRLQPQQLRLRPGPRLHVDDRRATAAQCALHEPVDERDVEARGDDDELERPRRDTAVRLQHRERRRWRIASCGRRDLQRAPPVAVGADRLDVTRGRVDDERALAAARICACRIEPAARTAMSNLSRMPARASPSSSTASSSWGTSSTPSPSAARDARWKASAPFAATRPRGTRARCASRTRGPASSRRRRPRMCPALREEPAQLDEPRIDDKRLRLALLDIARAQARTDLRTSA